ncbi:hypothetical protein RJ639_036143 [Escallonia herrerae]|uniref:Bifunctional inhibitor/plant lipid transfer protein/seed storage helical domain-containing protein n=1 Tax=Escallonia herrerae TaxID=1293975 RepID=A0AA88WW81_9ASTE|nr:hypothetical protein RJ639_036143 [Escallonia herrerae]
MASIFSTKKEEGKNFTCTINWTILFGCFVDAITKQCLVIHRDDSMARPIPCRTRRLEEQLFSGQPPTSHSYIPKADAAGECGRMPIRSAAASLSPCLSAAGNARAKVPPTCCGKVGALIRTAPKCLCVVLLSPLAKQAGIKPGIAITIPKRCNIRNRPEKGAWGVEMWKGGDLEMEGFKAALGSGDINGGVSLWLEMVEYEIVGTWFSRQTT